MTARFALTRTSDAAERIIARFLGGADIAFASRRPFGRDPALSAAGEPLPYREGAGLVAWAHCPTCDLVLEPWQSCLHIQPAPTPCAELPATVEPFGRNRCSVAGLSHLKRHSAGGAAGS